MNIRSVLIVLLLIVAGIMIYLGYNANMKPPMLTGVGFIIIAVLFGLKNRN